jgi:hypothetical protein
VIGISFPEETETDKKMSLNIKENEKKTLDEKKTLEEGKKERE